MIRFLRDMAAHEDGATMVEYALMLALIGASLVAIVTNLGSAIGNKFTSVSSTVSGASS